jgi:hypothetical protein
MTAVGGDLAGDGLIRPLNAPSGQQVLPGVQPGVSGGVTLAQYVVIFSAPDASGAGGGMFVYTGSPAPGNPPIFSVSNATEDPYGNAIAPGIWAGQYGQIQAGLEIITEGATGRLKGQLAFPTPAVPSAAYAGIFGTTVGTTAILQMLTAMAAATGPYSDRALIQLQSNPGTPGASASYFGIYSDTNGGSNTHWFGNYSGWACYVCQFLTAVLPGTGTSSSVPAQPETWHPLTLQNGWAQVGGGRPARYRLVPSPANEVEVEGNISGAAASSSTFATLVAPYVPHYPAVFQMQPTSLTLAGQYFGQMNTSGALVAEGTTLTGNFNFKGLINLDT